LGRTRKLRVDVWEDEELEIIPGLDAWRALDEKVGDKAGLVVQEAARWVRKERLARIAKIGRQLRGRATEDHLRVGRDLAQGLPGALDLWGSPRQLALPPLVVFVGASLAQHNVFEPVGGRPTAGRAALQANAPGCLAAAGLFVRPGLQLIPALGW